MVVGELNLSSSLCQRLTTTTVTATEVRIAQRDNVWLHWWAYGGQDALGMCRYGRESTTVHQKVIDQQLPCAHVTCRSTNFSFIRTSCAVFILHTHTSTHVVVNTHGKLSDSSAWSLGIVPQLHLRHRPGLVKDDEDIVGQLG